MQAFSDTFVAPVNNWDYFGGSYDPQLALVALTLTPVALLLAGIATRRELKLLQALVVVICLAEMAAVAYQLVERGFYRTAYIGRFVTYGLLSLILLLSTIVVAGMTTANFNKGLKQHLDHSRLLAETNRGTRRSRQSLPDDEAGQPLYTMPSRMEIE